MNVASVVAIGDIHGEIETLQKLLKEIEKWNWDYLVFLGDYIDRGKESKKVIDTLISLRSRFSQKVIFLKGNHEQWMLESANKKKGSSWLAGMEGWKTVASYSPELAEKFKKNLKNFSLRFQQTTPETATDETLLYEEFFYKTMPRPHLDFFLNLQNYFVTENLLCVHAGIAPGIPLSEQQEKDLFWIATNFYEKYEGSKVVIFGHMETSKLREDKKCLPYMGSNNIIGIDTSPNLTAFKWPSKDFITVFSDGSTNRGSL